MIVLIGKLLNSDTFYFPKNGLLKILNYSYLLAPSSSISIFLSFSFLPFSPLSLTEVHFGAKWSKTNFKKLHFYQNKKGPVCNRSNSNIFTYLLNFQQEHLDVTLSSHLRVPLSILKAKNLACGGARDLRVRAVDSLEMTLKLPFEQRGGFCVPYA